ncbi:MAG: PAS domain S-box protein, partial [Chloroflexales bacterium]|nr:PAS domain S-box protein [Chloroflexales bacterium]
IHAQGRILGCVNLGSHTLPEVPAFARHALETIAPEIGNVVVAQRTAAALHESQLRLELAVVGADLGTWDWEVPTGRTVFNERWAEIVGYTLAELAPVSIQTWIDLCHPDDLQHSDQLLQAHFAGETAFYECEARMRHKRGDWIWVIDRGKVVEWGADGTPRRMAGTHLDITARKQAELALRASEEHYRGLLESLDSVVVTVDAEGQFRYLNEVAAVLFGGDVAQLSGRTMGELFPEPVAQEQLAVVQQVIREDRGVVAEALTVVRGQPHWCRSAAKQWGCSCQSSTAATRLASFPMRCATSGAATPAARSSSRWSRPSDEGALYGRALCSSR